MSTIPRLMACCSVACVARVVPFEVVVLAARSGLRKVLPSLLGRRGGLRAVHPHPHLSPDRVEPPHLRTRGTEADSAAWNRRNRSALWPRWSRTGEARRARLYVVCRVEPDHVE